MPAASYGLANTRGLRSAMSRDWFQLAERGTPTTLLMIRWIALHIGRRAGRFLLFPITFYYLFMAPVARRGSKAYLRRVLGRRPSYLDVFRHFHCFAATILDRVYFRCGRLDQFDIHVYNDGILFEEVRAARGCILLGAHLGSFDVLRALALSLGKVPLKILMAKAHNATMTRVLDELNPEFADSIIPIGGPETLLKVHEYLKQGFLIGALGDRVVSTDRTTRCQFLGKEASFPAGPMLLACALRAPVMLAFGLYRGGVRYDVYFECLSKQVTAGPERRVEEARRLTQRYAERLEHYVKLAPYNWFNFYDYWNESVSRT